MTNRIKANLKLIGSSKQFIALLVATTFLTVFMSFMDKINSDSTRNDSVIFYQGNDPMITEMAKYSKLKVSSEDLDLLKEKVFKNQIPAVYVLSDNFVENIKNNKDVKIDVFRAENNYSNMRQEKYLNDFIKEKRTDSYISKEDSNVVNYAKDSMKLIEVKVLNKTGNMAPEKVLPVLVVLYLISIVGPQIATKLSEMKKERILERLSTTKSTPFQVTASLFIAYAILYSLTCSGVLILVNLISGNNMSNLFAVALYVSLFSILFVAAGFIFSRFNNAAILNAFGSFIGMALFFACLIEFSGIGGEKVVSVVRILNKFNPMYWAIDGIIRNKYFPGVILLILLTLALVTSTSLKFRSFAKAD